MFGTHELQQQTLLYKEQNKADREGEPAVTMKDCMNIY